MHLPHHHPYPYRLRPHFSLKNLPIQRNCHLGTTLGTKSSVTISVTTRPFTSKIIFRDTHNIAMIQLLLAMEKFASGATTKRQPITRKIMRKRTNIMIKTILKTQIMTMMTSLMIKTVTLI